MLLKSNFILLALAALSTTDFVSAREQWLERNGRAVYLYPRRFGQEQPAVLAKIRNACPGQVCGTLAGQAVTPLLAAQPECSQQDLADAIIDASKQFDAATQAAMVAAAVEYRQVEKNTPPVSSPVAPTYDLRRAVANEDPKDFTTNPPSLRNSVFCQKAPKNPELNGLVQAQDPANDPNLFFDPATKSTVRKGTQANTAPFKGAAAPATPTPAAESNPPVLVEVPTATDCATPVTVTVTGTVTATVAPGTITATAGSAAPAITDVATTPSPVAPSTVGPAGTDFGSCTVPEIEFGAGFDNRRETSFRPVDPKSFNHGSAQGIAIITGFICDTLTNSCKANQAAKDLCATAITAANAAPAKTGAQADAFNAVFGITTDFSAVAVIDDQGRTISPGTGAVATATPTITAAATPPATPTTATSTGNNNSNSNTGGVNTNDNGGIGNFGKCTVPQIEFGAGFDNRRETSFQPVDQTSFPHTSAQNIDIITQFMCDTLTNTCAADQTAKDTCQTARSAASAAAKGTGAQADAFNAAFGINTDFSAVQQIDNTGKPVGGSTAAVAPAAAPAPAPATNQDITTPATTSTPAPTQASNGGAATAGNLQAFTGALGGVTAPAVTASGNRFQVSGNPPFNDLKSAVLRSCDVQNNLCADAANNSGNKNGFTVVACTAQLATCTAQAGGN